MEAVAFVFSSQRRCESRVIGGAVMIDVVGLQHHAGEFLQKIIFFVCRPVRANDANGLSAVFVANFFELAPDQFERFFPGRGSQPAIFADQRLRHAVFVIGEVKSVTALDAEKIAVDAALVAVISANNFHAGIGTAYA